VKTDATGWRLSQRRRVLLVRLSVLFVIVGAVEIAPRAGWISKLALVPASEILRELWRMLGDAALWSDFGLTALRVLTSFAAAAIIGIGTGFWLWRRPRLYTLLSPYFGSYYAMPVFAFYPVLIAVFGLSSVPMILIGFAWGVIAVIDGTVTGFRNIPPTFHKTVSMYRMSQREATRRVYIPSAALPVFGGLKLAASYAMIGVIASEFVLSANGLGRRVAFEFQSFELGAMYATILLVILFEIAVIASLSWGERRIAAHRRFD
jgi:NitT/TauT family transport system permease protein